MTIIVLCLVPFLNQQQLMGSHLIYDCRDHKKKQNKTTTQPPAPPLAFYLSSEEKNPTTNKHNMSENLFSFQSNKLTTIT